jgi:hypothetical protein
MKKTGASNTEDSKTEKWTKIADLHPYMKAINSVFIVLEKGIIKLINDSNDYRERN